MKIEDIIQYNQTDEQVKREWTGKETKDTPMFVEQKTTMDNLDLSILTVIIFALSFSFVFWS